MRKFLESCVITHEAISAWLPSKRPRPLNLGLGNCFITNAQFVVINMKLIVLHAWDSSCATDVEGTL